MRKLIKKILNKLILYNNRRHQKKAISLKQKNTYRGNVLLSYIIRPFLLKKGESVSNAHTEDWESLQMARTFLDMGYQVDVIENINFIFMPQKNYHVFVGTRVNSERIAPFLNKDCIKITHLNTAHWIFHNHALYKRALELQQRKGITLKSMEKRLVLCNLALEYADYATMLGNAFTKSTYSYAQKPIFPIPISTCGTYPFPDDKNYEACRKNFLWFGSRGLLHKGLDLTLEAFADMPDYHLTVCGPIQGEKDFESVYYKELYQTSNIHTIGWIDVNGSKFMEIIKNCIGLIFPSCSEGQSGSVVNCLHAGLIAVVSYESGVDVNSDYGLILKHCSIEEIKNSVKKISSFSAQELRQMSRNAWEFARANHTRERFAEEFKRAVIKIIETHQK